MRKGKFVKCPKKKGTILKMGLIKSDWYFLPLVLVILLLIGMNEAGYGVFALLPGLLLAYWLMEKAFGGEKPK